MFTVNDTFVCEQEIKKSKFISFLVPFCEFDIFYEKLKKDHPKAAHIVYAYRFLNDFGQITENQTDDNEPKNSSGMPSLNALRGADLIGVAVFIVRYFGGTKLGVGGLVRAYSSSVNLVISSACLIKFQFKDEIKFFVPFAFISRFEHFFQSKNFKFTKDFIQTGANFTTQLTKEEFQNFKEFASEFNGSEFQIFDR